MFPVAISKGVAQCSAILDVDIVLYRIETSIAHGHVLFAREPWSKYFAIVRPNEIAMLVNSGARTKDNIRITVKNIPTPFSTR